MPFGPPQGGQAKPPQLPLHPAQFLLPKRQILREVQRAGCELRPLDPLAEPGIDRARCRNRVPQGRDIRQQVFGPQTFGSFNKVLHDRLLADGGRERSAM